MKSPAPVDDLVPEVATQLVLDDSAFTSLGTLAEHGVVSLRHMNVGELPEHLRNYDAVCALAVQLGVLSNAIHFWIGDLLIWSEEHLPEEYAQLAHEMGLSERTLLSKIFVCRNVPPERRVNSLSWSVHNAVAGLGAKEQKRWLKLAADKGLSTDELRERMKAKRHDERPPLPGVDDPPTVDDKRVLEVAKRILHDAKQHDDGRHHLVPNEDIAQLRGAFGEDE